MSEQKRKLRFPGHEEVNAFCTIRNCGTIPDTIDWARHARETLSELLSGVRRFEQELRLDGAEGQQLALAVEKARILLDQVETEDPSSHP